MASTDPRSDDFCVHAWRREQRKARTEKRYEEVLRESKRDNRNYDPNNLDFDTPPKSTERELEIEHAFWENMYEFLPHVLEKEGSVRGAVRYINDELEDMSHYDVDKYGKVSTPTFYNWVEKYADYNERKYGSSVLKAYSR